MDDLKQSFAEFWSAYPRRAGNPQRAALQIYTKLVLRLNIDPDVILAGTKAYAASRVGEDPKYTAHAATFLNQHRFLDFEPVPEVVPAGFYAAAESAELLAWDEHRKLSTGIGYPRDRKGGWWVTERWPPTSNIVEIKRSA